jgi:hypothetical protein
MSIRCVGLEVLPYVKSLLPVLLMLAVWTAPAQPPKRVPRELADEIQAAVQENVVRTFNLLKQAKQDIPAFQRALSQMLVYIRQGSMTNKSPQLLLSELNGYCNPMNDPLWGEFINGVFTTYERFYDTNPRDAEMHEEILGVMATAIGKGEASFFNDSASH